MRTRSTDRPRTRTDGGAGDRAGTARLDVMTDLGLLTLEAGPTGLTHLYLGGPGADHRAPLGDTGASPHTEPVDGPESGAHPEAGAHLTEGARQLGEYLARARRSFDLPIEPGGTEFQRSVWFALARIPFGTTVSYAELARCVGRPGAFRAVGQANGANPLPIILPCHRVIAADGGLGGYSGGLHVKARLLALESALPAGRSR